MTLKGWYNCGKKIVLAFVAAMVFVGSGFKSLWQWVMSHTGGSSEPRVSKAREPRVRKEPKVKEEPAKPAKPKEIKSTEPKRLMTAIVIRTSICFRLIKTKMPIMLTRKN